MSEAEKPPETELYFRQLSLGDMANLVYLVGSNSTRECVVIDAAWNIGAILDQVEEDGMKLVGALATHYHQDHIGGSIFGMDIEGLEALHARQPVPVHVNKHEAEGTARISGLSTGDIVGREGGDTMELGGVTVRFLHTPGHTPGSQCFLVEEASMQSAPVSGDTLFLGSCGRVDLPGANPEHMYEALTGVLGKLPDETWLFPGHLYSQEAHSTIGEQKQTNPFMRVTTLEQFLAFQGID